MADISLGAWAGRFPGGGRHRGSGVAAAPFSAPLNRHDLIVELAAAVLASPLVDDDARPASSEGVVGVVIPTHNDGPNIGALLHRLLAEPAVGEILVVASACDDETVPTVLEIARISMPSVMTAPWNPSSPRNRPFRTARLSVAGMRA